MSRWRCFVISTAPSSAIVRHIRARCMPLDRLWMRDASVAFPAAWTMIRWNSASASMKACVVSASSMSVEAVLERLEVRFREPGRRETRGDGLEDPPDLVDLEERRAGEEVADEPHPREQELGVEARDVRAVADPGIEDADERQGPHGLAERSCARARAAWPGPARAAASSRA